MKRSHRSTKERTQPIPPPLPQERDVDNDDESEEEEEELLVQEGGINIPTRDGNIYIPPAPPAVCSLDTNEPRLIITHIENENFKSYAGRRVLGPFHKSFTSIIGPNGSGKSNVIDSMLFVFGYRASKIRSKKISVLLHKSENHPDIRSCTVAVHFARIIDIDNDNFDYVPGSKFVIARTAFLDNSSFYAVDGKRSNFKVVSQVLLDNGIDLIHNRFLILQGEVEQIAMMKPKGQTEHDTGMLEYLEDIIGTSRYKVPIEKLAEEVEVLNGERIEKLNRVKLVEKERDALEGPMSGAVQFLEEINDLNRIKNQYFQAQKFHLGQEIEQNEKEKQEKEDGMSELKSNLKELERKQEEMQKEIKKIEKEYHGIINEKEENNTKYNDMNSLNGNYAEELQNVNTTRKKVKEQLKREEKMLADAEALPEKNKKEIEELKVVQEKLNSRRDKEQEELNRVMAIAREETCELQQNKESLVSELSAIQALVVQARYQHDAAKSELEMYLSTDKKEKSKLEQLKATLANLSNQLTVRRKNVEDLSVKLPKAQEDLKKAEIELAELRKEEVMSANELSKRRLNLEERRVAMNANRSRNRVIDFLLTQKQEGHLPGVLGRLGDLGAIDEKYDIAVSTACGPLDNIVVDTVKTAEACLLALKHNHIGRATIIALEKQEHLCATYTRHFQAPENAPRLFDLIKVADDRVRPAFYYALRDTLVANDIEQASRIAYGRVRYRVVTLKGELIETYGTMSGGGNTVFRGRMGRSIAMLSDTSLNEVGCMEQSVKELEARVGSYQSKNTQLQTKVEQLTRDVSLWSIDLRKSQVDVDALMSQGSSTEKQVKCQEARVKEFVPDENKVKNLQSTVEATKIELSKVESSAENLKGKIQTIDEEINKISGGQTKAAKKKLNEIVNKVNKVSSEIRKLNVDMKTAERNATKSKDAIKIMKADIEQAQETLVKVKDAKDKLTEEAKKVLDVLEDLSKKEISVANKLEGKKVDLADISKEENKLKAAKMEEDKIIKEIVAQINELKTRISNKEKEIKKLEITKIPHKDIDLELKEYSNEELESVELKKLEYRITSMEAHILQQKPNLKVIDEYYEKVQQHEQRTREFDEITEKRNEFRQWYDDVRKNRLNEFIAGFLIITDKLKEMYQMITLGGNAELELVDSLDPFTEGIVFSVRPPGKSWKNISNLSGGEKTLSSLALVFALHYYKPTPLYVMDEIDAALDFKNVSIVGHYIKERTKNAQFIIISLRANMFELADTLVGIFKVHNCTDSITITPDLYQERVTKPTKDHTTALRELSACRSPPRKVPRRSPPS